MLLEFTFDPILNIGSKVSLNKFKIDPIKFYRINWSDLSGGVDRILLKTSRSQKNGNNLNCIGLLTLYLLNYPKKKQLSSVADPDPIGSGLFGSADTILNIRIRIRKKWTGSATLQLCNHPALTSNYCEFSIFWFAF